MLRDKLVIKRVIIPRYNLFSVLIVSFCLGIIVLFYKYKIIAYTTCNTVFFFQNEVKVLR